MNGLGTLHGGMTNTMMDLVMSMAVLLLPADHSAHHLHDGQLPPPCAHGGLCVHQGPVTSLGKRNATAYCEAIVPATGKVACTAIGTYAIIPKK